MSKPETWTACYEVLIGQKAENYGKGRYGAFVNVVALASSSDHFRELAAAALTADGYTILGFEDLQMADLDHPETPAELVGQREALFSGKTAVIYGAFHTYPKEGLDG